jgi:hypothetical protein
VLSRIQSPEKERVKTVIVIVYNPESSRAVMPCSAVASAASEEANFGVSAANKFLVAFSLPSLLFRLNFNELALLHHVHIRPYCFHSSISRLY